jgi:hypothetical protein
MIADALINILLIGTEIQFQTPGKFQQQLRRQLHGNFGKSLINSDPL